MFPSFFSSKVKKCDHQEHAGLYVEKLEDRQMLSSVSFDSGVVTIRGSASDDVIQLTGSADHQTFTVDVNGDPALAQTYNRIDVSEVVVFAGEGNDIVVNTLLNETRIYGQGGDDTLQGGYLDDSIFGGLGDDGLLGRNGNDLLSGQGGSDILLGVNGDDELIGSSGDDYIYGGIGNDNIRGGSGNDRLNGHDGNDVIAGNIGDDTIVGGLGNDKLGGGGGDDLINGNEGDDTINAGAGTDVVNGGRGADTIYGVSGDNTLYGNGGDDRIFGGSDIDYIYGNSGDDRLIGNDGDDQLLGHQGNDYMAGGAGNDGFNAGRGNDVMYGGAGDDGFAPFSGFDRVYGGAGTDLSLQLNSVFESRITQEGANYRVFDIRIPGENSLGLDSGTNLLNSVEEVQFFDFGPGPIEEVAFASPVERVVVQPIIVANDDGSNQAGFFGTTAQEAETVARIDRIFGQAGVDVRFLDEVQFNSTFVNVGDGQDVRPDSDLAKIITEGKDAGVISSNPSVINLFIVQNAPGEPASVISPNNPALLNANGIVLQVSDPEVPFGRQKNAEATAQAIARNLGLTPTNDAGTLMNPEILGLLNGLEVFLTDSQNNQLIDSDFSRPI